MWYASMPVYMLILWLVSMIHTVIRFQRHCPMKKKKVMNCNISIWPKTDPPQLDVTPRLDSRELVTGTSIPLAAASEMWMLGTGRGGGSGSIGRDGGGFGIRTMR